MQNIIKKIVLLCLVLVPFVALHVADAGVFDVLSWGGSKNGLFFPFISGKNLIFRFLVEIAFAGWVILLLKDSAYRIKLKESPLTIAYAVFIAVLLIADIFGVDREKSMWSNFERMEGFVGHIHLFAYFVVLIAMLPTLKDWQRMFKYFLASNILVLIYGYGQLLGAPGLFFSEHFPKVAAWFAPRFQIHMSGNRLDATIGNSAYFAIFCLMFIFITSLLWSQAQTKDWRKIWLYPTLIALNLIALFYSGTRGTMIGLIAGGFATLGIIALQEKGKARKIFAGVLIAGIIIISSIFIFKNSSFIQSSPTLSRLASISISDGTGMSRLSMWKISYAAWLEHPILGYGQDNFSYIFARKFLPEKMCNLEPWYDRSHDVFFDWLVAAGALGLITYLSLYGVALSLLWRKQHLVPFREKAILTGMLIGYFIHNIFVFDNLTSYILFFALLAYIVMRTKGETTPHHGKPYFDDDQMNLLWIPAIGIVLLVTQYYINYRPFLVNRLVIEGMSINQYAQTMPFADAVKRQQDAFTSAIKMNTLGSEEAREQFLQMGVRMSQLKLPDSTSAIDRQTAEEAIGKLVQAVRDDITESFEAHKEDVRMLSIYGNFYNGTSDPANGEKILTLAHSIAPKKQLISFDLVRSYLMQNKNGEAYDLARDTYDLSITCNDAQKWYLLSAMYAGKYNEAKADVESRGQKVAFDPDILSSAVSTGQIQLAISILQDLKKTNPEYADQVDAYIKQIQALPKVAPPVKK